MTTPQRGVNPACQHSGHRPAWLDARPAQLGSRATKNQFCAHWLSCRKDKRNSILLELGGETIIMYLVSLKVHYRSIYVKLEKIGKC